MTQVSLHRPKHPEMSGGFSFGNTRLIFGHVKALTNALAGLDSEEACQERFLGAWILVLSVFQGPKRQDDHCFDILIWCYFFENDLKVAGEDLRTLPTLRGWLSSKIVDIVVPLPGTLNNRDMSPKETWAKGCWSCGFVCNFCVDSAKLFQKRFRSRLVKVKARAFSKKSLDFLAQGKLIAYLYLYRYCMILVFEVASQPSQNQLHLALTPCVAAVCSAKSWSQGHPQCHQNQSDAEMGVIPLQPCEWIWTSAKTMFFTQFSIICWVSDGFTIQDGMLLRYQVCRVFQCQSRKCEVPAPACPETLGEGPCEGLAAHIFLKLISCRL